MKNLNILLFFICSIAISCASSKPTIADADRDGTSFEKSVVVKNVSQEYEWVKKQYPGGGVVMQALLQNKRKYYDMLKVETAEGKTIELYFDINSFTERDFKESGSREVGKARFLWDYKLLNARATALICLAKNILFPQAR